MDPSDRSSLTIGNVPCWKLLEGGFWSLNAKHELLHTQGIDPVTSSSIRTNGVREQRQGDSEGGGGE